MQKKLKAIIVLTAIIGLVFGFFLAIYVGVKKQEEIECQKWQRTSETNENFYWTNWQKEQCNINN